MQKYVFQGMLPNDPVKGDIYHNPVTDETSYFDGTRWVKMNSTPQGNLSSLDRIMLTFEKKVNEHPDMNVKMKWVTEQDEQNSSGIERLRMHVNGRNDPDFWLGVATGAYQKGVVTKDEMKDILLALRASGAKSDYFEKVARMIVTDKE